jgi:hypothetical protein
MQSGILGAMTPEPSDPSVVSVEVPLYAVPLPPIGWVVLAVVVIVAAVLVLRRLHSQGQLRVSQMTGRTATVIVIGAVIVILAVMSAAIEWVTWSSGTDRP